MQVRNAIVAVTVAAFALTLSACTADPSPTPTDGSSATPSATASGTPTAAPTTAPTTSPVPAGEIRPLQPGYDLANVSDTIRGGFPSFEGKTDDEIEVMLNAACDAMDAKKTPEAGADALQSFGIDAYDAAFTVSAAISLYCPEYAAFLGGNTGSNG